MLKRIETPAEIAEGENGAPAFVIMQTQPAHKYKQVFLDAARQARQGKAKILAKKDISYSEASRTYEAVFSRIIQTLAYIITDWNWLDIDTGQPLPKPNKNPAVFKDELTADQQEWLFEQVTQQVLRGTLN